MDRPGARGRDSGAPALDDDPGAEETPPSSYAAAFNSSTSRLSTPLASPNSIIVLGS